MAEDDTKATPEVIDFTGVKDKGRYNPKRVKAGAYKAKIVSVEQTKSSKDQGKMWVYEIKLAGVPTGSYPYRCKIQDNQLWKIRNLFVAAGLKVPKKKVKVDPNKPVDREIGVEMEDDEYEGRPKSEVGDVFPLSELDERDLPDTDSDDEEVDDEEGDEEEEEVDEEELEEIDIEEV